MAIVASLLLSFQLVRAQTAPTMDSLSPDFAHWGETVQVYGDGFGSWVDESTTQVTLTSVANGEVSNADIQYPPSAHWTNRLIRITVPPTLEIGYYELRVVTAGGSTDAKLLEVVDYNSPANLYGTPDYTSDYIIANTQSINVSDAIRRISQGMLLPSKETIVELGKYLNDALVFKLDIGADGGDDTSREQLVNIWKVAQGISNTVFVLMLVVSGFLLIFRVNVPVSAYSVRQMVVRLLLVALLVNVTFFLSQLISDITVISTLVILDQIRLPDLSQISVALLGELRLSLFVLFMLGFYLLVSALMAFVVIMLLLRVVAVWLLIGLSPLVFTFAVIPRTTWLLKSWFKRFLQLMVMGPVVAFLLFVGVTLSQGVADSLGNPDVLRAMIGTATLGLMLSTPFWINSFFGLVTQISRYRDVRTEQEKTTNASAESRGSVPSRVADQEVPGTAPGGRSWISKLGLQDLDLSQLQKPTQPSDEVLPNRLRQVVTEQPLTELPTEPNQAPPASSTTIPTQEREPEPTESPAAETDKNQSEGQVRISENGVDLNQLVRKSPTASVKQEESKLAAAAKLFARAPKMLLNSWLGDSTKQTMIRDGITEADGKIGNEKAVTVFDHPNGKLILQSMVENGSNRQQNASATMISDVLLAYPDRIDRVLKDSADAPPPINLAAQTVLKAGIAKLGEQLINEPNNERLQKAAERVVRYAPDLLTNILATPPEDGAGFIRVGIREVAQSVGEQIGALSAQGQLAGNPEFANLSGLATQTLLFPKANLAQLGGNQAEQNFVAAAVLSESPDSQQVMNKLLAALSEKPDAANLQAIAAAVFRQSSPEQQSSLPSELLQAVGGYLGSAAGQGDTELAGRFLLGAAPEQLLAGSLSGELVSALRQSDLQANLSPDQAAQLPLKLALASDTASLLANSGQALRSLADAWPTLSAQGELADITAAHLASQEAIFSQLPTAIRQQALSAFDHPENLAHLPSEELGQLAASLLQAEDKGLKQRLNEDTALRQKLINASVENGALPNLLEQWNQNPSAATQANPQLLQELLKAVSKLDENTTLSAPLGALRQLLSGGELSADNLQQLVGQLAGLSDPLRQQAGRTLATSLPPADLLKVGDSATKAAWRQALLEDSELMTDPETAARVMLLSEPGDIAHLPWEVVKQVMEYMTQLDRSHPLYAELSSKVEAHPGQQPTAGATAQPETPPAGVQQVTAEAATQAPALAQPSAAMAKLQATDFNQLQSLDINTVKAALAEVRQNPDLTFDPETAAKLVKAAPTDQLKDIGAQVRSATAQYLLSKPDGSHTAEDAEIAARLVAATPNRYLIGLNQSILTLAATIAKSNLSFADRDQLQLEITKELKDLVENPAKQTSEPKASADQPAPTKKTAPVKAKKPDEEDKPKKFNIDL